MRYYFCFVVIFGLAISGCGKSADEQAGAGKEKEPVVVVPEAGKSAAEPTATTKAAADTKQPAEAPTVKQPAAAAKARGPVLAKAPEPKPPTPQAAATKPKAETARGSAKPQPAAESPRPAPGPEDIVRIGMEAPSASFASAEGKEIALAELLKEGKLTVLVFIDSSSTSLRTVKTFLDKPIAQAYKDRGVRVVAVQRGGEAADVKSFGEKAGVSFPILLDPKAEAFGKFAHQIVPRLYLIDSAGKVLHTSAGAPTDAELDALTAAIEAALK